MLCSHCPVNGSSGCLHITMYLAVMLQASWHTAEGNSGSKGSYIKSWCITKITHMGHTSEFPFGIYWWTLKNPKNQNFGKRKKKQKKNNNNNKKYWRYHHFTQVYQKPQLGTAPEIWSDTFFLSLRAIFCLLSSPFPNTPENQNLKKKKKSSGDVIILKLCNKKHNQMMYAYSNMECDRHNFLSF